MPDATPPLSPQIDFFSGHVGHLSSAEQDALATFKSNLTEANLYSPSTELAKASHDEPTLLYVTVSYHRT